MTTDPKPGDRCTCMRGGVPDRWHRQNPACPFYRPDPPAEPTPAQANAAGLWRCISCGALYPGGEKCARVACIRERAKAMRHMGIVSTLSDRERAILHALAKHHGGRLAVDLERSTPGGRPAATLVALERRGLVKVNRRRFAHPGQLARIAGAYITSDGLEALLLSNPHAEVSP